MRACNLTSTNVCLETYLLQKLKNLATYFGLGGVLKTNLQRCFQIINRNHNSCCIHTDTFRFPIPFITLAKSTQIFVVIFNGRCIGKDDCNSTPHLMIHFYNVRYFYRLFYINKSKTFSIFIRRSEEHIDQLIYC